LHLHVLSLSNQRDFSFAKARPASAEVLDASCQAVRSALIEQGWSAFVPEEMGRL